MTEHGPTTVRYPDDVTDCSLCTETLKDPRQLPCIHTFCLKCIEEWAEKRKPEGAEKLSTKLECPLCRKESEIPEGGVAELPRNVFVQLLLEVKVLTSGLDKSEIPCDVCSESESDTATGQNLTFGSRKPSTTPGDADIERAVMYCMECRKNLCENCCRCHRKFTFSSSHSMIEFNGQQRSEREILPLLPESTCDKHVGDQIKIYCVDCKVAVCMICCIKSHKSHECLDIGEAAGDFTKKMNEDRSGVDDKVAECEKLLGKIAEDEKQFLERLDRTEKEILNKCEEMKKVIEDYKSKLIGELDVAKARQLKQTGMVRRELEDRVKMLRHFSKYVEELSDKGKAYVITHAAPVIRARAKELLQFDVYEDLESERTSVDIVFVSQLPVNNATQVFGDLKIEVSNYVNFVGSTKPVHVILNKGYGISGVAVLDDELFIMRFGATRIKIYSATTFNEVSAISVSFLSYGIGNNDPVYRSRGLVACPVNKCLYVSDLNRNFVHKVDTITKAATTKWKVGKTPYGLSVNTVHNVLVACYGDSSIHEYTTEGKLVRQISLQSDVTNPVYVVQLCNNQFGIIHKGTYHRYCVIDADGQLVKSYGSEAGSSADGRLNKPFGLAVHRHGSVFIADASNNRVVVIHPTSFTAKQLPADLGLKEPYCLHIDETRHRLYIGELSGRVIALENCSAYV